MTKNKLGGGVYLTYISWVIVMKAKAGTQGRNLEAGIDSEAIKEHCLLTQSASSFISFKTFFPVVALPPMNQDHPH